MLMLSGTFNSYLKVVFHQPRPYWISSKVQNLSAPMGSFGLPSGHSQNAASVFGLLAASTRKRWFRALIVFVIVMVAFSRLVLGVHSIADILLGLTLGLVLLWAFIKFEARVVNTFRRRKPVARIGLSFGISIALLALGGVFISAFRNMPIPEVWLENTMLAHPLEAIAPFSVDGLITSTATLFGLAAGYVLILEKGGYQAGQGVFWQHVLRFVIGIAGVLLIWKGLGLLFPRGENLIGFGFRYVRYALIGAWITGLAPALFIRAKLGVKDT
jgi:hypothetical protein